MKLAVTLAMASLLIASVARAAEPIALKIFYAGHSGSEREADFVALLEKHFAKVGKGELSKFTPKQAAEYDVVILDWTSIFTSRKGDGTIDMVAPSIEMPPIPKLDEKYDRPTVLIGAVAGHFGNENKLKINWLCLCLNEAAHGMKADHDIFHKPLEVKMDLVDHDTPANYREFPEGKDLPATMKVLPMQTKTYPQIDPGLVSDPYGFEPTPDAEVMSSGLNMKGPHSVAIGRHGNYLQWGFSASPKEMTDAGRACFVNCVSYIHKFDHQRVVVHSVAPARTFAPFIGEYYTDHRTQFQPAFSYAAEMMEKLGESPASYAKYFHENIEYVRVVGDRKFTVDEEARKLGLSNRKIESLEKLVIMLEKNESPAEATTLLRRYTDESFEAPAQWRKWLDQNKSKIFFTDVGGYKWMVPPAAN
jgi:hypothetical protein